MRTILLSYNPSCYKILKNGDKFFEYRKRFCDEKVMAYLYLGKPIQQIVGILWLDKRISLTSWKELYKDDLKVLGRIEEYLTRNKYAMSVLKYQEIRPINIGDVKRLFPDFYIPLSFRNLEEKSELLEYLQNRTEYRGKTIIHKFDHIDSNRICEM